MRAGLLNGRMPFEQFLVKHSNGEIYTMMQGPSEFGIGGTLANWDIKARLKEIKIPDADDRSKT